MDPQSPPKRITRSRAAKVGETTTNSTRVMTAAAKAKATASTTRATAATKRKARSDEVEADHDEEEDDKEQATSSRATRPRGRPKTLAVDHDADELSASSSLPGRATRARAAARKAASEAPKAQPSTAPTTGRPRGRPRKVQPQGDQIEGPSEPPKKATRTRAATITDTKGKAPAVKKRVTFEEPEKENVDPVVEKKKSQSNAPGVAGLRGRPRKPAVPKVTRGPVKTQSGSTRETKAPLSPKKVTQMPYPRDESEDELTANDKASTKALMKGPLRPATSALGSLKNAAGSSSQKKEDATIDSEIGGAGSEAPESSLGSPARRPPPSPPKVSMKSPAKRADGIALLKPKSAFASASNSSSASIATGGGGQATPLKTSLLNSPAKRPQSAIKGFSIPSASRNHPADTKSPFKTSLLQTPAKRPAPHLKPAIISEADEPSGTPGPSRQPARDKSPAEAARSIPQISLDSVASPQRELPLPVVSPSRKRMVEEENTEVMHRLADELLLEQPKGFPGRLSDVLPRHADPSLKDEFTVSEDPQQEEQDERVQLVDESSVTQLNEVPHESDLAEEAVSDVEEYDDTMGDPMMIDEPACQDFASDTNAQGGSPPKQSMGMFGLREKDTNPCYGLDSEDEDEDEAYGADRSVVPMTPTPAASSRRRSLAAPRRVSGFGFTPLAQKLDAWSTASPLKIPAHAEPEASPAKSSFFDDEMRVRDDSDAQTDGTTVVENSEAMAAGIEEPEFDNIMITNEDMQLAAEADEMSLLEPGQQVEQAAHAQLMDDTISEASQEYGDENEIPIDPAILQSQSQSHPDATVSVPPVTPVRHLTREFHTVTKVPLKGGDEPTPGPKKKKKKRAASISRLPVSRPSQGLTRSATVISYSPMKHNRGEFETEHHVEEEQQHSAPATPVTPAKTDVWSTLGTPARTPRRDLNSNLLGGAVVFVDVHTSEGADASGIFVELLNQMGARCVKQWSWNPDSQAGAETSKIGITHVVFKDGGKRTMEKVRQTGGVVQCVGVSWVLDCERENEWLDEAPYYIDTALVPRGGARRRKSMEPKALANFNGMLVPTPVKGSRDTHTAPNTPMNRRDSALWMHTPSDQADDDDDQDWPGMLTPVPVTPAPEALARYAASVEPETPTGMVNIDGSPTMNNMVMRTCPPKPNAFSEMGHGILDRNKDEGVLMRLMAARRKSLQFAPKVGSPLSKAWP